ncbi:exodeoxyribonuclease V [Streptomyces sp. RB6PN25]|uniref:Exodeoxyribonuclease V n=1 Tax=Streptomyces humicola TaxID=2953240 RepID=A0ABT1Q2H0_9ACTN|nr:helix-hairpin-helix domain-containing protein [Streptomyces humicola]MCQ4084136.1 exodeoxyribonuclease V [Streptomyces humicola]
MSTDRTADEGGARQAPGSNGQPSVELSRLAEAVRKIERGGGRGAAGEQPQGTAAQWSAPTPAAAPAEPVAPPPTQTRGPELSGEPVEAARQVLAAGGAPPALAEAAVDALGERAGERLHEDPWLVLSLAGVRVDQADGFARALLGAACRPDDERRGRALVTWLLERAADAGHTALEWPVLRAALEKQSVSDADAALRTAVENGQVMVFHDAQETPGAAPGAGDDEAPVTLLLGLDRYSLAEESLADGLGRLLNTFEAAEGAEGAEAEAWEAAASAAPSPSAAELVRAVAGSALVTHSGGEAARAEPAALVAAARAAGLRAVAAAHTEDGRRRLGQHLGEDAAESAVTVDGLLSGAQGPGRSEDGTLALDVLAVLDAPQLDVESAATLVESVPDGARLVLSGDPGVLWSASGPGRAFADLVAAKVCPHVASRTPDPGPIGELVSGIGVGELTQVEAPGREVVIVPVHDAGEAVHRTVQLVADSIPRAIGVPAAQTQVITAGHGGAAGTRSLNAVLKERLNPGPGRFAGFDPGDRVVYEAAAGRAVPGVVVSAEAGGLRLECEGAAVLVPRDRVATAVRHGWAVTAQQAVGRRWRAVVVVLPGDAAAGLTRSWVYTAFGRGERHLSVVHGVEQALPGVVAEVPAKERTTRLRTILRDQAEGI